MINAPHDKEFVFHDGTRAKNLLDLVSKMEHMADHEFHHFVNPHKNDFSNWIEHVLMDKQFAQDLREAHSRDDTIKLIKDKISDMTVGNSIIKIPRIAHDEADHTHNEHIEHQDHAQHQIEHVKSDTETSNHIDKNSHDINHTIHEHGHDTSAPTGHTHHDAHKLDSVPTLDIPGRAKTSEAARHNWFKFFSKRSLSEKSIEKVEREEEDKLMPEAQLNEEYKDDAKENALWVVLYVLLVVLIITLLVYKLFLS